MERIKAAVVLPYFGPGGAEKMVATFVCALDQRQFDTEVFCVYGQPLGNAMERSLREHGITVHYIGKKKGFSLSAIWKLFRELERFHPDVVHTHQYACVYAALWPVLRRRSMLHTFHTLPEIENQRPLRRILTKLLVGRKRMIPVAISETNRQLVADYYGLEVNAVPLVHNPVDIRRFSAGKRVEDGLFRFITVGRFSKEKNQQMMYRAFGSFLSKGHDARLLMLGKGTEEAGLRALAAELGIADRIDYAGYVDNVEDYLKTADVFLLSSHYEAQPLCVLEAMAAGKPVISTAVGGVGDLVTDNGLLIPADDAQAMAQAMETLYLDAALREQMSDRAIARAAEYDVPHTAAGYAALYRRYAGRK